MTREQFKQFVQATFNAMDIISPAEGATAVLKAFDEYEAAEGALGPLPPWQPIESCPKDGTWFLAWDADCGFYVYRDGPGFIAGSDPSPTHWLPLPAGPLPPAKEDR